MKRICLYLFTIFFFSSLLLAKPSLAVALESTVLKEASVYPLYRLDDKDITIEWSTLCKDGITISYGDETVIKESEGKFVIPAEKLAFMPESFDIRLKVNAKDGDERKFMIETFKEPRELKLDADQFGMTERYQINFVDKEWDNDLVIQEIELDFPKSIYIRKNSFSPNYLEVYTKWEYYNDNRDVSGFLRWESQYISQSNLPAAPKGLWTFRFWNSPRQPNNPDIQPSRFDPIIIFTIGAKDVM